MKKLLEKIRDLMTSLTTKLSDKISNKDLFYVLDTSVCGYPGLSNILEENHRFMLTSITIKELERLQKGEDIQGSDARKILNLAADNGENFILIEIAENSDTPDDCIIDYCNLNKENVILLTSDKSMALKARMKNIKTLYLKHETMDPLFGPKARRVCCELEYRNGKLITTAFSSPKKTRYIYSNNIEYTEGAVELQLNDSILVAVKTKDGIFFIHYLVTSFSVCNNVQTVFCKKFYNIDQINDLSNAQYKAFLRRFWRTSETN